MGAAAGAGPVASLVESVGCVSYRVFQFYLSKRLHAETNRQE